MADCSSHLAFSMARDMFNNDQPSLAHPAAADLAGHFLGQLACRAAVQVVSRNARVQHPHRHKAPAGYTGAKGGQIEGLCKMSGRAASTCAARDITPVCQGCRGGARCPWQRQGGPGAAGRHQQRATNALEAASNSLEFSSLVWRTQLQRDDGRDQPEAHQRCQVIAAYRNGMHGRGGG